MCLTEVCLISHLMRSIRIMRSSGPSGSVRATKTRQASAALSGGCDGYTHDELVVGHAATATATATAIATDPVAPRGRVLVVDDDPAALEPDAPPLAPKLPPRDDVLANHLPQSLRQYVFGSLQVFLERVAAAVKDEERAGRALAVIMPVVSRFAA